MAVIMGLRNWRHLLIGSPYKVIVYTDHANLQYYWHLQKINRCVARYISELADYNIELRHLPGIKNRADLLSQRSDHDDGSKDNESVLVLLEELFARIIKTMALDEQIRQNQNEEVIKTWIKKGWKIHRQEDTWWKDSAIVVTNLEKIQKALMETYHDSDTAGHPGIYRTFTQIVKDYWWPDLHRYT